MNLTESEKESKHKSQIAEILLAVKNAFNENKETVVIKLERPKIKKDGKEKDLKSHLSAFNFIKLNDKCAYKCIGITITESNIELTYELILVNDITSKHVDNESISSRKKREQQEQEQELLEEKIQNKHKNGGGQIYGTPTP
jgi:hypothetical protein